MVTIRKVGRREFLQRTGLVGGGLVLGVALLDATDARDALASGDLGFEDLTARRLGSFLGKTTSVLYHHWGDRKSVV